MTETVPPDTLAAALQEITRLQEELAQLRRSAALHAAIIAHAPLLVSCTDLQGNLMMANPHFKQLDGEEPARLVGRNEGQLFAPAIAARMRRNERRAAESRCAVLDEESFRHRDQSAHTYATVTFPLPGAADAVMATATIATDITGARAGLADSISDELTGLKNRRYFDMLFMDEQRRAHREGRTLTLLLADVDGFAAYNAQYGSARGDAVLRQVAAALGSALNRPGDLSFRIGGDEFACLFVTSVERESMELAERIRELLAQAAIAPAADAGHDSVTLSVGVAFLRPDHEDTLEQACARAEQALARARQAGRNTVAR